MDIYSKMENFVKDGVDYDSLYEKNAARVDFVIKFNSEVDAVAAMNDIKELDEETNLFNVVQNGNQINVETDCDKMVELMTNGDLDSEDIVTIYGVIGIISFNHNCIVVDEIGHALITRK